MSRPPVFIENHQKRDGEESAPPTEPDCQPPPEEQLGGGDICSLEEAPSTDDDKPLD